MRTRPLLGVRARVGVPAHLLAPSGTVPRAVVAVPTGLEAAAATFQSGALRLVAAVVAAPETSEAPFQTLFSSVLYFDLSIFFAPIAFKSLAISPTIVR